MSNIHRRLDRIEKRIHIGEKPPTIFEYVDDKGVKQKIEIGSDEFDELLKKISGKGLRLPSKQELKEHEKY